MQEEWCAKFKGGVTGDASRRRRNATGGGLITAQLANAWGGMGAHAAHRHAAGSAAQRRGLAVTRGRSKSWGPKGPWQRTSHARRAGVTGHSPSPWRAHRGLRRRGVVAAGADSRHTRPTAPVRGASKRARCSRRRRVRAGRGLRRRALHLISRPQKSSARGGGAGGRRAAAARRRCCYGRMEYPPNRCQAGAIRQSAHSC